MTVWDTSNELYHHGTKGMKWGNRRYQNADGSLTEAGKKRYGYGEKRGTMRNEAKRQRAFNDMMNNVDKADKIANKAKQRVAKGNDNVLKAFDKHGSEGSSSSYKKANKALDKSIESDVKFKKAVDDVKASGERMKAGVKALDMSAKELDYRKAKRDFDKFTSKAGYLGGPAGVLIGSYATKKGREFANRLTVTSNAYKEELKNLN